MKITITNESGDFNEMLYRKDMVTYEVTDQEIIDFFTQLSEVYLNDENMDEMYERLYNLLNFGYLYEDDDIEYGGYDNFDEYDDADDYEYDDDPDFVTHEIFKLISSEIEYYVDEEKVSKEEYDDTWDDRLGYLGSSNWEEKELSIINTDTDEIIFLGKIS